VSEFADKLTGGGSGGPGSAPGTPTDK
jgi:hypothetical protein